MDSKGRRRNNFPRKKVPSDLCIPHQEKTPWCQACGDVQLDTGSSGSHRSPQTIALFLF